MGHQRLGELPATKNWREVIDLLAKGGTAAGDLAEAVFRAMDAELHKARSDPVYLEVIRLLLGLVDAARSENFESALREVGIIVPDNPVGLDVIMGFSHAVEVAERKTGERNDLGEMARLAAISSLAEIFSRELPMQQLELPGLAGERRQGPGLAQRLLSSRSPEIMFADLVQNTAVNLTQRIARYYLDRLWPETLGRQAGGIKSFHEWQAFDMALTKHFREASFVMRALARDWFWARKVPDRKSMTPERFASYMMEKIRREQHRRRRRK